MVFIIKEKDGAADEDNFDDDIEYVNLELMINSDKKEVQAIR